MHKVVKIKWTCEDTGAYDEVDFDNESDSDIWHLAVDVGGVTGTFCQGQVYEFGVTKAVFKEKIVKRGGITCERCLEKIREIKAVRL